VNQDSLDRWLPTLTRYLGFLMAVVLFVFLILGHWEALPGFVPSAGLLTYGAVRNAARQDGHA
jgi:hypothetical protein